MTEVLACAQQPLLTYLLEVLIVDDAPSGCVIKKSNGRCRLMVKTTREEFPEGKRRCSHKKHQEGNFKGESE